MTAFILAAVWGFLVTVSVLGYVTDPRDYSGESR